MTANKPMTGEQLDELMTVAVNMQRDSEKQGDRPTAMFAYAVQVAVLELRKVRDDAAALALRDDMRTASPEPEPINKPVAWLWSHRKHPSEVTLVRPEDDDRAEGAHWSGWSCQALYAAPPEPVAVPDEATPENIEILASTFAPRGVTYQWDRDECNAAADSWNACRAAMLQGAEQQSRQQNIPENIPATQFNPVADLYGLTSPTGSETSFTFDAVEARDFIDGGWSCQEYVELERFQEAVIGNSPVIPDGWVACSERLPEIGIKVLCFPINDEPIHATYNGQVWLQDISWSTSYEPIDNVISCNVFHWMPLPAAPQQEAK